jgi:hypothetical protein
MLDTKRYGWHDAGRDRAAYRALDSWPDHNRPKEQQHETGQEPKGKSAVAFCFERVLAFCYRLAVYEFVPE